MQIGERSVLWECAFGLIWRVTPICFSNGNNDIIELHPKVVSLLLIILCDGTMSLNKMLFLIHSDDGALFGVGSFGEIFRYMWILFIIFQG